MSKKAIIVSIVIFVIVAVVLAIGFARQSEPQGWWSVEFAQPSNNMNHDFIITNTDLTTDFTYTASTTDSNQNIAIINQKTINIKPMTEEVIEPHVVTDGNIAQVTITVKNGNDEQTIFKNIEN